MVSVIVKASSPNCAETAPGPENDNWVAAHSFVDLTVVVVDFGALAAEAPMAGPSNVVTTARVARALDTARVRDFFDDTR